MSDQDLISTTVSRYRDLLRIETAENRDMEITNQKRELRVMLEAMGITVENLKIGE